MFWVCIVLLLSQQHTARKNRRPRRRCFFAIILHTHPRLAETPTCICCDSAKRWRAATEKQTALYVLEGGGRKRLIVFVVTGPNVRRVAVEEEIQQSPVCWPALFGNERGRHVLVERVYRRGEVIWCDRLKEERRRWWHRFIHTCISFSGGGGGSGTHVRTRLTSCRKSSWVSWSIEWCDAYRKRGVRAGVEGRDTTWLRRIVVYYKQCNFLWFIFFIWWWFGAVWFGSAEASWWWFGWFVLVISWKIKHGFLFFVFFWRGRVGAWERPVFIYWTLYHSFELLASSFRWNTV